MELKGYSIQGICPAPPKLSLSTRDDENDLVTYNIVSLVVAQKDRRTMIFPVIVLNGELTIFDTEEHDTDTEVLFDL